jgi:hypothetical protein
MFGCYRKGDANDPEIYVAAVAAVLSEYPESVIDFVTDPRTGLPRKSKWLPNPAEVSEACEEHMAPIRHAEARRRQVEQQMDERASATRQGEREAVNAGFKQLSASLKVGELVPSSAEDAA